MNKKIDKRFKEKVEWFCKRCKKKEYLTLDAASKKQFCSKDCWNKNTLENKIKINCKQCGKLMLIKSCDLKNHKQFCSLKCKFKAQENKPTWNKGISGYNTSRKGMKHSEETKIKMSINSWTKKEGYLEKYFKTKVSKPSRYEILFSKILDKNNINYITQAVIGNKYQVDFLVNNLIIEIDGEWHYKEGKLIFNDIIRDCFFRNNGYNIIHIKNSEIEKSFGENI